ncbi:DUF6879 family protein [Streptodolium elevatio]|uniref:DUF6879 family protein n=1 Tax=Streptodolium elevatio TaxID=3157996 RepID=A0ABV3D8F9_9ACTN
MPELITGPGITEFFRHGFEHTAWRLESRRAYGVASETEALQAFMRGEDVSDPGRPWLGMVREQVKQGKRIERVRVVDEPPTDYQRFLLADVEDSIAAGEDIRFLWRSDAETAGLPSRDFWVFDSRLLGRFHFDGDRSLGMELFDGESAVLAACQIRDAAWHFAAPYTLFQSQVASRM